VAVNLSSRYPHGSVDDADYERVRDRIIDALSALVLPDGVRAFRSVRRREDVYSGAFVGGAPDVVVEPDDCLDFGMNLDAREAVRRHRDEEGHHSPRGLVSLSGPGLRKRTRIEGRLADCVPTILHALGLAVPTGLDGRVIEEAFDDGRPVRFGAAVDESATPATDAVYSAEEEEELRRSLEGLGYL
jgi:predicted AlkP superfamily phosphohydrolase/phosphomutase